MHLIYDELSLLHVDLSLSELTLSSFIERPTFRLTFIQRSVGSVGGKQYNIMPLYHTKKLAGII